MADGGLDVLEKSAWMAKMTIERLAQGRSGFFGSFHHYSAQNPAAMQVLVGAAFPN